ncbi:alpha/beta fold hydrolase [Boseaceae bacterium BT-24-1]|nr:alpha/beta fold hydrolase [Boseaceae bacterium BT-24-1]
MSVKACEHATTAIEPAPGQQPRSASDIFLAGGPTGVLLIHGLGGTPVELKLVARGLHAAGYTVHCCTLAGHCGTEAELAGTRWTDWCTSVDAAFVPLAKQCTDVFVGGLSMGGILALHLAARHQAHLRGLLLYAPTLWYDGWSIPWYRPLLKFIINTPLGRRYRFIEREPYGIKDPRIRQRVAGDMIAGASAEAGLLGTPALALRELWRLVDVVRPQLRTIKTPTLLVQAREDDVSSLSNSAYLMQHLGGIVDLTVLDDSYHIVTIDQQRTIVIDRTIRFIKGITETNSMSASRTTSLAAAASSVRNSSHDGEHQRKRCSESTFQPVSWRSMLEA